MAHCTIFSQALGASSIARPRAQAVKRGGLNCGGRRRGTLHFLRHQGCDIAFGIVGYPVRQLAFACQEAGMTFIACRNEQAASYAAGAVGYLTGRPGACSRVAAYEYSIMILYSIFNLVFNKILHQLFFYYRT